MRRSIVFKALLLAVTVLVLALLPSTCVFASWQVNGNPICMAAGGGSQAIVSDGAGGAFITWEDGRSGDGYGHIYAQRVNASGIVQWTTDGVPICTATGNQANPQIISDGAGGAIVTWQDSRSGSSWDIYAQRVNALGIVQWTTNGVPLCTATGIQDFLAITSDGAGGAIVVWNDTRSGSWDNHDIYAQRVNAWGAPQWTANGVGLCTATGDQQYPKIVSDGAGGAIVAWEDQRNGIYDIYAQRVNASGAVQWTANGVGLCTATGNQASPTMTSDGAGGAIVTWWDFRNGSDWDIYAQRVNASGSVQWIADGVAICTATDYQDFSQITSDGAGGAIITWDDLRSGNGDDIYAQRVNSSGAVKWAANGVALCTATGYQQDPTITSDGAGGAIVAWGDTRSGYLDTYAQSVSASGAVRWTADGFALCTATGDQGSGPVVSDGAGGAIVTWNDTRSGSYHIYAQRLYPGSCANPSWLENGNVVSAAPYGQRYPQITPDGAGGAIMAWQDNRTTADWDIYAQRVNASGCALWALDGSAICTSLHDQQNLQLIPDGAGGAIITWEDYRGNLTNADIYAQRVNASGYVEWTLEGVPVTATPGESRLPRIVSDGAGGAIIAWEDNRSGISYDIFAQRLDASGVAQWTANGIPICSAAGDQGFIRMIPDGAGGAVITWQDNRSGTYKVYAQRVNASGGAQWTPDGFNICTVTGVQQYPQIVSDGSGGAVIAWQDSRDAIWDIYAQRVDASGNRKWFSSGVAICTAAGAQSSLQMISDGYGGAVLTWEDTRLGDYDIYTQRVNASGSVRWTLNGTPICAAAHYQRYPQIMSGEEGSAIIAWQDNRTSVDWDIFAQKADTTGNVAWPTNGAAVCKAVHDQAALQLVPDGDGGAIVTWEDYRSGTNYDIYAGRIKHVGTTDVPYAGVTVNALRQNYPNPFNPATLITFSLRAPGEVKLQIYDVQGRLLRTIVDGRRGAGEYRVMWDGKRDDGTAVASGVYFYRLKTSGLTATRKMVLLR